MSRPEILAPAGNREMLGAAVFSGADAVYLGLTGFNARRTAGMAEGHGLAQLLRSKVARGAAGVKAGKPQINSISAAENSSAEHLTVSCRG